MNVISELITVAMFAIVMLGWFGFTAIFLILAEAAKNRGAKAGWSIHHWYCVASILH